MKKLSILGAVALSLALATSASASVIGDDYFFSGTNFPVTFPSSTALTFNNTGDITAEPVPGSGAMGGITVIEQVSGLAPSGAEVLRFAFTFNQSPADLNAGFGFTISGLESSTGAPLLFETAAINVIFGSGNNGGDVTALTTATTLANGLSITFDSGTNTWNDFFTSTPTSLIVDFQTAVQTPEPSTLALFGLGLIGVARRRRRS